MQEDDDQKHEIDDHVEQGHLCAVAEFLCARERERERERERDASALASMRLVSSLPFASV